MQTSWRLAWVVATCLAPVVGCGSPAATGDCAVGSEDCECTSGGACDTGLVCLSSICVNPNPTAGAAGGPGGSSSSMTTGAGGSGGGPPPDTGKYMGLWKGTTSQNLPIQFAVDAGGVLLGLQVTVAMNLGSSTCTGPLTLDATQQLVGNSFSGTASYPLGSVFTTVSGTFDSTSAAHGTFEGFSGGYSLICGSSLIISTGGTLFSNKTWQATNCPSCSLSCSSTNDDVCDEPAGLGLCFAGTDAHDCCSHPHNGVCEEPSAGGVCTDTRDFYDCGYCKYTNDGVCDEPKYCPVGTDTADCAGK